MIYLSLSINIMEYDEAFIYLKEPKGSAGIFLIFLIG